MRIKNSLLALFIFMYCLTGIHSQETGIFTSQNQYKGNNAHDFNDVSGMNTVHTKSSRQIEIETRIKAIKEQNLESNRSQLQSLNAELDQLTGTNSTRIAPYYGGTLEFVNQPIEVPVTDNITNIRVASGSLKAMGTYTEQRGANIGKIWAVYALSGTAAGPDSLRWAYSTNNGLTWTLFATATMGGTDKINYDDLDVEIIENTTGDKYLWTFYGFRGTAGTGRWQTGGTALNITAAAGTLFALAWPGDDPSKRYYGIRVASDNAQYPGLAYLYIACSFDSTAASHVNTQKFCRVTNPYVSTAPTVSYMATRFFWFSAPASNIERTLHTDVCYIRNGSTDSVLVSFSNVPDSTAIFFAKTDLNGNPVSSGATTSQKGTETTAGKQFARLSSNGYDNGSVICVFRQQQASGWNVKYFRTTNYGNFGTVNQSTLWGSTANVNYQPDIVGLRGKDVHYFAFNTITSTTDSVHSVKVISNGTTAHIQIVNFQGITSGVQGSKPGVRYAASDSCLTLYSESGPVNVWAALGCSGPITGVNHTSNYIPERFSLSQNYPNPFNPVTMINFNIPVQGNVKLEVFDVLGRSVSVLVDQNMKAGTYNVDFSAGSFASGIYFYTLSAENFKETKKMLLVK